MNSRAVLKYLQVFTGALSVACFSGAIFGIQGMEPLGIVAGLFAFLVGMVLAAFEKEGN